MRNLTLAALAACAVGANAGGVLWNNGPLVTNPGGGFGGADASVIESNLFGWGAQGGATQNTVADDFVVGAGEQWTINRITVYSYQTGSTTTPTHTGLFMKIWNTNPLGSSAGAAAGGVYGDLVTNEMDSAAFTNIYRVTATTLTNNQRPIMAVHADVNIVLTAGTYYLGYNLTGSLTSGPWVPPVTPNAAAMNTNAMQAIGSAGAFAQAWQDGATASVPGALSFQVEGTVVPEPGTFIAIGIGLAGLALARRRK